MICAIGASDSLAAKQSEQTVFQQTRVELEKLSSGDKAPRQAWLNVVRKFRSIHRKSKGEESAVSLFYTGRALVQCYKAHGDAQDLENGIKALNEFKKIGIGAPYDNWALVELKDAHLIKLSLNAKPEYVVKRQITPAEPPTVQKQPPIQQPEAAFKIPPAANITSPIEHDVARSENIKSLESRPPLARFGNPFYSNFPGQSEKKTTLETKTASLPPKVVTDTNPVAVKTSEVKSDSRVIVLDPGHGGKDPGAVSKDGSLTEKDVTLRIAKKLKRLLEKSVPNLTVKLTREDDTFLSLKERTAIANSASADLFVSIHCNGSEYSSVSGVETFFLSQANSRGAMRAAARENGISLSKMNHLEATLIDLMMTSKRTESEKLAETIHDGLMAAGNKKAAKARDRGVKQAPFYVLMGAAMPAILVECAFISNMSEKNDLKNERYIDSIAEKLTAGAKKYLSDLGRNG